MFVCGIIYKIIALAWVWGSSLGQIVPQTSVLDAYTALVPVNIRCINNPDTGLTCNAEYPDQCKERRVSGSDVLTKREEQWKFPNPCTQINLSKNMTKFVHPFDKTKFLMCGDLGKLYVVQCPQFEVYHKGCGQCVGQSAGLTASCETPLPQMVTNPCSREAILANKLFFPFPRNISKFIHCDIWGKAWERICTPGEVWSQFEVACVNPVLLNPCARRTIKDAVGLFPHPCDPFKYLMCDSNRDAMAVNCEANSAFFESKQKCEPISTFVRPLENICGNFQFGFRAYSKPAGRAIFPAPVVALPEGQGVGINTIDTILPVQGVPFTRPQTGINSNMVNGGGQSSRLNEILNMWRKNVANNGKGVSRLEDGTAKLAPVNQDTTTNQPSGQMSADSVHPSQLKDYVLSTFPYSEPCTLDNLANRRTHFRLRGDPHSFLQCDNAGRMYKMPCSTNRRDWFDVYTMTCVDGPVHVDNRILRG